MQISVITNKATDTGNFVGPLLFKEADAPGYAPGFIATVITSIIAALLALVYRFVCIWENKRRDEKGVPEGFDHAYEDDLTDMKVRLLIATFWKLVTRNLTDTIWLESPIPLRAMKSVVQHCSPRLWTEASDQVLIVDPVFDDKKAR